MLDAVGAAHTESFILQATVLVVQFASMCYLTVRMHGMDGNAAARKYRSQVID
jgi:hypothetical protein